MRISTINIFRLDNDHIKYTRKQSYGTCGERVAKIDGYSMAPAGIIRGGCIGRFLCHLLR